VPELPEIEAYRRLAVLALDRPIVGVEVPDPRFSRGGASPRAVARALTGHRFESARRHGKLLVLDVSPGAGGVSGAARRGQKTGDDAGTAGRSGMRLGLRFGMTGRLLVDGRVGVEHLEYASDRAERAWDRLVVRFVDGGDLVVRDPRLLGGVLLDPDEDALGPDALIITRAQLGRALAGSAVALKARLMDQARVAGIGNLLADEILWRASLAPGRRSASLLPAEVRRLHRHLRGTLDEVMTRGGSHLGDMTAARHAGGRCPRDGAALIRSTVGGRTTWWCPRHQH
jgi:formamidopyrimidine-DNA glycosylase